ncbi:MAG: hypothetical protein E6R03_02060 [Hyphomicrobiaceae bacterium]|nr:MAG: hypothetical protein E6R03_02060 [Hyphomicrobiaceae bacterium]
MMTARDITALRAAASLMRQGICPWCDQGKIGASICGACVSGQINGAICAECHGTNIISTPTRDCPDCQGTGRYPTNSTPKPV